MSKTPINPKWQDLILGMLATKPSRLRDIVTELDLPYLIGVSYTPEADAVSRLLGLMRKQGLIYSASAIWYVATYTVVDISTWPSRLRGDPWTFETIEDVRTFLRNKAGGDLSFAVYKKGRFIGCAADLLIMED